MGARQTALPSGAVPRPGMPDAGTWSNGSYLLILGAFAVVFLAATWAVLAQQPSRRRPGASEVRTP